MKEAAIRACILQHDASNLRLKRRLAEHGIDFRGLSQVCCRFQAGSLAQLFLLAEALRQKGFVIAEFAPLGSGDNPASWRVEAQREASIGQAASHEFTEDLVRCAAAFSCLYQGWSLSHSFSVAA